MVNFILGVSLTLNLILVITIFLYFKTQKNIKKNLFCSDEELDDMLDRL